MRDRQQRLLNRRRHLQLLLELRLVERLAVQPRVLDRQRRFGRQRVERRRSREADRRAPRSRLSRYSTPIDLVGAFLLGALDVAHQAQRRAQHVADAERDRAGVQLREVAVEQILDDRLLAGGEDLLGNLAARLERAAGQRHLAARARQLELEHAFRGSPA